MSCHCFTLPKDFTFYNLIMLKLQKNNFQACTTTEEVEIKIISLKGMKRGQCVENCNVCLNKVVVEIMVNDK